MSVSYRNVWKEFHQVLQYFGWNFPCPSSRCGWIHMGGLPFSFLLKSKFLGCSTLEKGCPAHHLAKIIMIVFHLLDLHLIYLLSIFIFVAIHQGPSRHMQTFEIHEICCLYFSYLYFIFLWIALMSHIFSIEACIVSAFMFVRPDS